MIGIVAITCIATARFEDCAPSAASSPASRPSRSR